MIKTKAHQRYKTEDGKPCVGVTTVLGVMNKPALVGWANKLGLDGYDVNKFVDALADIGTLIHYLIECDISGKEPELGDYTANHIATAKEAFKKWIDWKSKNDFKLLGSEMKVISDKLCVGGTCDIYCELNGKKTVLDIKTSKACYDEQRTQVCAYAMIMEEMGLQVDECRIIRIGRDENEGFDDILIGGLTLHRQRFVACLALYHANKNITNGGA